MSNARIGVGSKLQYSSCATATSGYVAFAELLDIDSPSPEYPMIDCTNMDTTGAKDYIPGSLVEGGKLDVQVHYTSANATKFNTIKGLKRGWRVRYPGSACHRFQGYLTTWSISSPVEGKMTAKGSIQVTSLPTYSATTTVS